MPEFSSLFFETVTWLFLLYGAGVFLIYVWISVYALGAVLRYKKQNSFTDYSIIAANPNPPAFSVIAPAYNEGMTIVENVRSLLSLYYHRLEIIIVNDGSKDDSMERLISEYELEAVSFYIQGNIPTKEVRGIYKSKNPAFRKLIVVDKENGGKADALNVGVNVSSGEYLVCIDVDCILEQDAILKLAKPFLEQTGKRLIACGGVIRLANNCKVENGKVTDVNIPKSLLGRTQALEYIRAFVLGRMAWSRASGLILISGAFGVFDREIVLAVGGYDSKTVGEDMELVVRMRKYMEEKKEPYEVLTIPDPLCWTEVPESKEILRKQRNRWMRGTMETLWKHRRLMLNPKYGRLGMISLPYWCTFEFMGPLVEFLGYLCFIIFLFLGIISWKFFFILLALVLSTGFLFSIYAILVDLVSHQVYVKRRDFLRLIFTAALEPFYFHPIVVQSSVRGFIDYFRKNHSWGEMTRQGFGPNQQKLPLWQRIGLLWNAGLKKWGVLALVTLVLFGAGVLAEWLWYRYAFPNFDSDQLLKHLVWNNGIFILKILSLFGAIYLLLWLWKVRLANIFAVAAISFLTLSQFILFLYFSESHNLLGADLFYYDLRELEQILAASGMLTAQNLVLIISAVLLTVFISYLATRFSFRKTAAGWIFLSLGILLFAVPTSYTTYKPKRGVSDFEQTAGKSKLSYFLISGFADILKRNPELTELWQHDENMTVSADMIDPAYPFWREENTPDFLGPYFKNSEKTPNLVLVIVEGLGHAYSSPSGYVGNFTPFFSDLQSKSLSWQNALSSSGRTFSAIPTLTGSLPFGKNGFLEIPQTPANFNLFNVLKRNGFKTGFFYGGNSDFDRIKNFLQYSGVDQITDEFSFGEGYQKLPQNRGESWGYEDQSVFRKALDITPENNGPYFNAILTLSSHNPFKINNQPFFERKYDDILQSGQLNPSQMKWARENKDQLISIINADSALHDFFENYKKRADFQHTIFIVTGDHSMPEIPLVEKIDRYHVPLIIYSPLLKEPKTFHQTVSHFDVAPSVLAFYRTNYHLATPKNIAWVGQGFQPVGVENATGIPMMQSKNQLIDYVQGNYHLSGDQLYKMQNLTGDAVDRPAMYDQLSKNFEDFKKMNSQFYMRHKLFPDSVVTGFLKEQSKR
ncbi:sulfatase-like hydrolase/transferase [Kaistella palustris]|uniref:sulfatase-like hydrolase/transferase n=1 Tax=Kaistella palustris TaxID=493376 RepID=UPI000419781B|nr:sulfatase-like hydrolase/transferase [Kaistella palustris]